MVRALAEQQEVGNDLLKPPALQLRPGAGDAAGLKPTEQDERVGTCARRGRPVTPGRFLRSH
jgi:hypothetical protein